ncbi:DUF819 family protein [Neolewinella persica]|uniref:DUF819 family protein n=1 Tax=Neolewinella persica TaxID=70998 RepID=UPI000368C7AB|nr:DUF819 family protein [Neolewinella persica]
MLSSPLFVLTVLCLSVVASEWLVKRTFLKHFGTALVVILFVAVLANVGILPSASEGSVVYTGIFRYLAPLSIFYLLLDVNLASIRRAGASMLLLFGLGSIGTVLGVFAGMWLIDGATHFGGLYPAISGMFTGTYSGGSVNFNAVAIHYDVMQEGVLYAGMTAVDNIITAVWMVVTLGVPMLLRRAVVRKEKKATPIAEDVEREYESISIISLGVLLGVGLGSLFAAQFLAGWLAGMGLVVPSILILTTIALVLAQFPVFHRLAGGQVIGLFCVYLFLAVIGAFCELAALGQIGALAWRLLALVVTIVVVHGAVVFGVAALGKLDWDTAAVASQANIGGSSSALALAKSLDRMDLYLPGILVGSLGNGVGTYLGFMVAGWLG